MPPALPPPRPTITMQILDDQGHFRLRSDCPRGTQFVIGANAPNRDALTPEHGHSWSPASLAIALPYSACVVSKPEPAVKVKPGQTKVM